MTWDAFQREVLVELGHVLYIPMQAGPLQAGPLDALSAFVDADMLARIARAAGIDSDALQAHDGIAAMASGLRGDAAAKRALWPRLRALRRNAT